ncbi:hypothetical protein LCGC14_1830550, partial [marine sediment metagenome]
MVLTPEEQVIIEERFEALEDRNAKLERLIRSGKSFTSNPQALATDLDDIGSIKTHLDFEESPLVPTVPPDGVSRLYAPQGGGFMPTLLEAITLTATAQTLADFTDIPLGFRNLRVVYSGESASGGSALRNVGVRLNGDAGSNYNSQISVDGAQTESLASSILL